MNKYRNKSNSKFKNAIMLRTIMEVYNVKKYMW